PGGTSSMARARPRTLFPLESSALFLARNAKHLSGIDAVRIADLLVVGIVNHGVARAIPIGEAADAPQAVAAGHDHWLALRYPGRAGAGDRRDGGPLRCREWHLGTRLGHAGGPVHLVQPDLIIA